MLSFADGTFTLAIFVTFQRQNRYVMRRLIEDDLKK